MNNRISVPAVIFLIFASQSNTFAAQKQTSEPNGLAQLAKDDKWGEPKNGLVTQLIPQSEEYVVGKPMKFGLVLKNISNSKKDYNRLGLTFKPFIIKTPDNNIPYDKIGPFSTQMMPDDSIDPCEVVTLVENHDITEIYVIIKPGKYTIQCYGITPSNVIEFEVMPGTPDERDL